MHQWVVFWRNFWCLKRKELSPPRSSNDIAQTANLFSPILILISISRNLHGCVGSCHFTWPADNLLFEWSNRKKRFSSLHGILNMLLWKFHMSRPTENQFLGCVPLLIRVTTAMDTLMTFWGCGGWNAVIGAEGWWWIFTVPNHYAEKAEVKRFKIKCRVDRVSS